MYPICTCSGDLFCDQYRLVVTRRLHHCLRGTSGLTREQEEFYIAIALGEGPAAAETPTAKPTPQRREKPPSIVEKGGSLASALWKRARSGFRNATAEETRLRLDICSSCDELQPDGSCMQCGCPVAEKARWATEDCPLKKWPPAIRRVTQGGCGGCGKK